ncbi:MAG TPA: hypothetical protein VLI54_02275 [Bacillota bacterium]|nr:hypothetical protein [Bacillota bacterium]
MSPQGAALLGVLLLGLAYISVSLAIDNGSIWLYIVTLVVCVYAFRQFVFAGRIWTARNK